MFHFTSNLASTLRSFGHTRSRAARTRVSLAALLSALLAVSCARVQVTPISNANRMTERGFRYYLPRPFVAVKKPFTLSGGEFLVPGVVDPKNQVIRLGSLDQLPAEIRSRIGGGAVPFSSVTMPFVAPDLDGGSVTATASASTPSPGPGSGPAPVADNTVLAGSSVSPSILGPDVDAFTLTVKLAKGAPIDSLVGIEAGLVPIGGDGKPDASRFITVKQRASASTLWKKGEVDGVYPVIGLRSGLPSETAYAIAARVQGKRMVDGAETTVNLMYYMTQPALTVVGPTGNVPPPSPSQETTKASGNSSGPTSKTTATLATSGNPATSPLLTVNDLFDIVYLPDFDEQYAVRVRAGLGQASANVGLEQGWQLEQASVQIDNRELGKFVFENTSKLIDLGVKAGSAALGVPLPTAVASNLPAALAVTQAATPVLLRIRVLSEAQPGLYPVLKPQEAREQMQKPDAAETIGMRGRMNDGPPATGGRLFIPYPPYSYVAYNVIDTLAIELVTASSRPTP
jgi:hypothetical protein